jgi:hypothetical protein
MIILLLCNILKGFKQHIFDRYEYCISQITIDLFHSTSIYITTITNILFPHLTSSHTVIVLQEQ